MEPDADSSDCVGLALANDASPVRRSGFNTQTWVEDGVRYFAISDVNAEDIRRLCDLLKQSS